MKNEKEMDSLLDFGMMTWRLGHKIFVKEKWLTFWVLSWNTITKILNVEPLNKVLSASSAFAFAAEALARKRP